jgi:hypothetical protein
MLTNDAILLKYIEEIGWYVVITSSVSVVKPIVSWLVLLSARL